MSIEPERLRVDRAPTKDEICALAALCSTMEWEIILLTHHGFITASTRSLSDTEYIATRLLGRTISLSRASLKNPGDEKL